MQPSDLLDLIKAAYRLESDYQVMKKFGFSQAGISKWRTNSSFPNDEVLKQFSTALDIDLGVLSLHSTIWRTKDPAIKAALERILRSLAYIDVEKFDELTA